LDFQGICSNFQVFCSDFQQIKTFGSAFAPPSPPLPTPLKWADPGGDEGAADPAKFFQTLLLIGGCLRRNFHCSDFFAYPLNKPLLCTGMGKKKLNAKLTLLNLGSPNVFK